MTKIWNTGSPQKTWIWRTIMMGEDYFDYLFCDFHSSAAQNHLFFSSVFIRQSFSHIVSSCVSSATSFGWRCLCCQVGGNIPRISQRAATLHDILPNFPHRVRDGQTRQGAAASKSTISNLSHRLRDGQTRQRGAVTKSTNSNLNHRVWDFQTLQRAAAIKSKISNLSHRLRDGQTRQRAAVTKDMICNPSHRLWDGQTRQRAAATKSTISNPSHRLWDGQSSQRGAVTKRTNSNLSHRLRDFQTLQRAAARKSKFSNLSHRLRDGQTRQRPATLHDILPNFPHRVRDGQTRQRGAASKSTISNLSHRLWDGQTSQRGAATTSTNSNLNHRLRDGQICQRAAAKKSISSNLSHRPWDGQTSQRGAVTKSAISNLNHRLRDGQICQRAAAKKNINSNLSHRPWDGQTSQRGAVTKSAISNLSHRLRDGQTRQRPATLHDILPNFPHRVRDGQTRQRLAASKSMISNPSHKLWDGQTSQRGAVTKCTVSNLSHRLRDSQTRQRDAFSKSTISNLSHRPWDRQTSQQGAVTKCTISNLSHRLRDCQTLQRAAARKNMICNPSHRLRDGQTPQRAAAKKSINSNPSHRLRDNQSQQVLAVLEGMWLDGCFSARDAYVTQFLHCVAKCINALNCRLDIEDNLQIGRVEHRIWDGHLKIIQFLPVKDKLHGAEYPGDLILWWMENLHFFFQLSDRHFWPHCQGVNVATEQFHIDVSCHRNSRNTQMFQAISGLEPLRCPKAICYQKTYWLLHSIPILDSSEIPINFQWILIVMVLMIVWLRSVGCSIIYFHECGFARIFQKSRKKGLNIIFPTQIIIWSLSENGVPQKPDSPNLPFKKLMALYFGGGHPSFLSLLMGPQAYPRPIKNPWPLPALGTAHVSTPGPEAAVVKNFAVKCGKHVGVSIHMGTPLSLAGWLIWENPWKSMNQWRIKIYKNGAIPHDLGNLHLKLTILGIKKIRLFKPVPSESSERVFLTNLQKYFNPQKLGYGAPITMITVYIYIYPLLTGTAPYQNYSFCVFHRNFLRSRFCVVKKGNHLLSFQLPLTCVGPAICKLVDLAAGCSSNWEWFIQPISGKRKAGTRPGKLTLFAIENGNV